MCMCVCVSSGGMLQESETWGEQPNQVLLLLVVVVVAHSLTQTHNDVFASSECSVHTPLTLLLSFFYCNLSVLSRFSCKLATVIDKTRQCSGYLSL